MRHHVPISVCGAWFKGRRSIQKCLTFLGFALKTRERQTGTEAGAQSEADWQKGRQADRPTGKQQTHRHAAGSQTGNNMPWSFEGIYIFDRHLLLFSNAQPFRNVISNMSFAYQLFFFLSQQLYQMCATIHYKTRKPNWSTWSGISHRSEQEIPCWYRYLREITGIR